MRYRVWLRIEGKPETTRDEMSLVTDQETHDRGFTVRAPALVGEFSDLDQAQAAVEQIMKGGQTDEQ